MPFFVFAQIPAASDDTAVYGALERIDIANDADARLGLVLTALHDGLFTAPFDLLVVVPVAH